MLIPIKPKLAAPRNAWYRDMTTCRTLIARLMRQIEDAISQPHSDTAALWSGKDSPIGGLERLVNMYLKIHAFERENRPLDESSPVVTPMGPEDTAIIARFLQRT